MFCNDVIIAEINLECAYHMVLTCLVEWDPLSILIVLKGKSV